MNPDIESAQQLLQQVEHWYANGPETTKTPLLGEASIVGNLLLFIRPIRDRKLGDPAYGVLFNVINSTPDKERFEAIVARAFHREFDYRLAQAQLRSDPGGLVELEGLIGDFSEGKRGVDVPLRQLDNAYMAMAKKIYQSLLDTPASHSSLLKNQIMQCLQAAGKSVLDIEHPELKGNRNADLVLDATVKINRLQAVQNMLRDEPANSLVIAGVRTILQAMLLSVDGVNDDELAKFVDASLQRSISKKSELQKSTSRSFL